MSEDTLELLCLGRAGIDLYADQIGVPLEEVRSFSKYVGGCAGNIAVGSSRLGLRVGMLTRVGDDGLGRFVRGFLASEGVEVSGVTADPEHLTGLAIVSIEPPDRFPILFYRVECADTHLSVEDVQRSLIPRSRGVLVTGTGLSREPSRGATRAAVALAKASGRRVVLDIDYRPMLWPGGTAEFKAQLAPVLAQADLVVGTEEEVAAATSAEGPKLALERLRALAPGVVVMKRGPRGAAAYAPGQAPVSHGGFRVQVLNTLGAGDGFMSGFLRGWLSDWPLLECLRLANAVGAIVVTRHGCSPAMPTLEEAQTFMKEAAAA